MTIYRDIALPLDDTPVVLCAFCGEREPYYGEWDGKPACEDCFGKCVSCGGSIEAEGLRLCNGCR